MDVATRVARRQQLGGWRLRQVLVGSTALTDHPRPPRLLGQATNAPARHGVSRRLGCPLRRHGPLWRHRQLALLRFGHRHDTHLHLLLDFVSPLKLLRDLLVAVVLNLVIHRLEVLIQGILRTEVLERELSRQLVRLQRFDVHLQEFLLDAEVVVREAKNTDALLELFLQLVLHIIGNLLLTAVVEVLVLFLPLLLAVALGVR